MEIQNTNYVEREDGKLYNLNNPAQHSNHYDVSCIGTLEVVYTDELTGAWIETCTGCQHHKTGF